jgi:hypothetical protein
MSREGTYTSTYLKRAYGDAANFIGPEGTDKV